MTDRTAAKQGPGGHAERGVTGRTSQLVGRVLVRVLPTPRAAPLASAMVLLLVAATLALRVIFPDQLADVVAWTSTNVENLADHPVAALLASVFVVPGGLLSALLLVAVGFTALERSIGTLRTAAVALSGHILATLLTEYGAYLLTDSATDRPDVGVSYAMFAVLAAAALRLPTHLRLPTSPPPTPRMPTSPPAQLRLPTSLPARLLASVPTRSVARAPGRLVARPPGRMLARVLVNPRAVGSAAVAAAVLIPFAAAPGLTTTGHLLAAVLGPVTMALLPRRRVWGARTWQGWAPRRPPRSRRERRRATTHGPTQTGP